MTIAMPILGAGTFRLKGEDAYHSVAISLEAGYRHIDTAQYYENEKDVGAAIIDSGIARSDIFLTTKIWMDKFGKGAFLPSIRQSLDDLQVEYVDLLLIHWPLKNNEVAMEDYLASLKEVKDLGLAKQIGISNFTVAQMQQAMDILGAENIYTNQVEVHPYLQNRKVVDFCRDNGIIVTGYMPFAYGEVLKDEVVASIAEKHQATTAQVVLAWMRQSGFVTIPSSTKRANIESNLKASEVGLDAKDMAEIARLDRNHRLANPDFAPEWD